MIRRLWIVAALLAYNTCFWSYAGGLIDIPRKQNSIGMVQRLLVSPVDGKTLYPQTRPEAVNCTESLSNLSLQKLWIQDQPGGDLTTKQPQGSHPATPEMLAVDLQKTFSMPDLGPQKVVILVVDDFNTALHIAQDTANADSSVRHGPLVRNQIDKMIQVLELQGRVSTDIVTLQNRTTASGTTQKTEATMASLAVRILQGIARHPDTHRFVVNMSFAQLSCRVLDDYKNWLDDHKFTPPYTFREYAQDVQSASVKAKGYTFDSVEGSLISPDFSHPSELKRIASVESFAPKNKEDVVLQVAAAGNYAEHFPLFPAAWPNVIGVSASAENYQDEARAFIQIYHAGAQLLPWSNWGDVTERGQWFEYDRPNVQYPTLYYYGTSFATPLASLRMALTLMHDPYYRCPVPDLYPSFSRNGGPLRDVLKNKGCLK